MNGRAFHCTEQIDDVFVKGEGEEEKIYVKIKRDIFAGKYPGEFRPSEVKDGLNRQVYVIEGRVLVFMRDHKPDQDAIKSPSRVIMPQGKPDFSYTMIPTRDLLFRFSALTFNAHRIHFDKAYCREVEGHRNLLVQGNLMVLLVVEVLRGYFRTRARGRGLASSSKGPSEGPERILSLQYQNLRPLYVDEEMKICVRKTVNRNPEGIISWEVWIEGTDGGYSFRGRAKTYNTSSIASRRAKDDHGNAHQESGLVEEMIPNEHVALQNEANARLETYSSENAPAEKETVQR